MGQFFLYASFPNSRIKSRNPTTEAFTYQKQILDYTQPLTLVAQGSLNRTYVLLNNFSSLNNFWYVYATTTAINPSVVPTYGNPDDLIFFTGTNTLYQKQDFGTNTNWIVVAIQNVGEKVLPLQSATLDALQDIYCASDSAVPLVPNLVIGVDEGEG